MIRIKGESGCEGEDMVGIVLVLVGVRGQKDGQVMLGRGRRLYDSMIRFFLIFFFTHQGWDGIFGDLINDRDK